MNALTFRSTSVLSDTSKLDGFTYRLSISCVRLSTFHIRLYVNWRDQLHLVAKLAKFARPLVT
jgi:hypothetical protein